MAYDLECVHDSFGHRVTCEHCLPLGIRGVKWSWRCRCNKDYSSESIWSPASQYLGDFSAHGMSHQHKVHQIQLLDDTFNVVGLRKEVVILCMVVGFAPAPQVNGDTTQVF